MLNFVIFLVKFPLTRLKNDVYFYHYAENVSDGIKAVKYLPWIFFTDNLEGREEILQRNWNAISRF